MKNLLHPFVNLSIQGSITLNSSNVKLITSSYNVAIIGGGATGVELITELVHIKKYLAATSFNETHKLSIQFTLIDATNRILSALSEDISSEAEKILSQLDVKIQKIIEFQKLMINIYTSRIIQEYLQILRFGLLESKHQML
ncbi:FAD-dependent oxidoreductase [Acinetobacter higginsii]|uniref:FAD-dependent oxidoreductase n=1 Tax=Acinetobacter higginsii TaxID=70347 RepID=UPI002407F65A|nr:FAD-dependent oxidoreductase [Acinetobacter higginsii]